jgi:5-methylcytosine-specific restriction enzyme subunit McrC
VRRIIVREGAGWQEHELSDGQAAALRDSEIVLVASSPRRGHWRVRNRKLVGTARLGRDVDAIEVHIRPKTEIRRLLFLVGYRIRDEDWREEEVEAGEEPDLVPAMGHALAIAAERALRPGVLLGYRETEEALALVRGRIREADQSRRRFTMPLPVEVRYDDYTSDVAENQLLRAAIERVVALPGVLAATRTRLNHLLSRLQGVSRLVPRRPLPTWRRSRLNARYHTALSLAELILRGASYELDDGTRVRVDGLLLDMWRVFEAFVTVALADALRTHGGRCKAQDLAHYLDHARRVQLKPDLVWYQGGAGGRESPAAVLDVKYTVEKDAEPDHLYQVLAYCTALGVDRGHLVYAEGVRHVYRIHRSGVEITAHAFDLTLPPGALLAQVGALATEIADAARNPR